MTSLHEQKEKILVFRETNFCLRAENDLYLSFFTQRVHGALEV
jgi:hypothetical protein